MNDAGRSDSVPTGRRFEVPDERLSAELRKWTGTSPAMNPVGELLDRHWEAAFAYARLCTDGTRAAGMLTTAAFTRLVGESIRQSGPSAAWRPHLLVTVRRIAAEWDGDGRRELLHPALRTNPATGERASARLLPPPGRRLLSRAFQRLPQSARAVLWHIEVEAEPLAVPAALLGQDEEEARVGLGRARERLREECLQAHRELAPETECRRYLRMLDVTFRRGGADVDQDLRRHLAGCPHCRRTADQLARFGAGLGLALAEAVLGWGARAYLEARAGLPEAATAPEPGPAPAPPGGEAFAPTAFHAPTTSYAPSASPSPDPSAPAAAPPPGPSRRSALRAARRARRRHLALGAAAVGGLVVLPLVLWAVLGPSGDPAPAPGTTPSPAPGKRSPDPGPSWAGTHAAGQGALRGRLRNLASGLCVDVVGGKAVKDAEAELAACSAAPGQQWRYEPDGLLRSASAPDLCLDSHLGYSVRLAPCPATARTARDVRYDFTGRGAIVPRSDRDLALVPAAADGSGALVLKTRTAAPVQRWSVDSASPELEMEIVNWDTGATPAAAPSAEATHGAAKPPAPAPTPAATGSTAPPASSPAPDFCSVHPSYCSWGGGHGGGHHRRH
ncbi:ricin-type beta-trefoil lectin domain protein [Streptomyces sp. NPDC014684]|uniref:ricin-type beta-trefoil lectin domain protein n=1 Tax=Streptomyces sp. NPDC014684 TaxID=3364880 RepID=UPI0037022201